MNIFSLRDLFDGEFDRNFLKMAFLYAQPLKTSYYKRFGGKSKTFKKNQRRGF